jgi:glycosyltransferase involved in cell wall biosynthesis
MRPKFPVGQSGKPDCFRLSHLGSRTAAILSTFPRLKESPSMIDAPTVAAPPDTLRGRDILCFSNDWSGDPLSKTHLMRLLSRDNRVLWVNSIGYRRPNATKADAGRAWKKLSAAMTPVREAEPNLFVLNPLVIPIYDKPAVKAINRRLLRAQVNRAMRRLKFKRPINYMFLPSAALVAGDFHEDLLIYHCVDEFTAFSGVASQALAADEEALIRRSDLVVVSAELLLQTKSKFNPNTVLVRHGVDFEHFRKALDPATPIHKDIANLPRPIIGYFGLIAQDWVDIDLLVDVAKRFPDASLVMLGKTTMDVSRLEALSNVHLLGRKPYADLPSYSKGFDVALIPFPISEVTLNSNPLKAREYLAAGLPVVSTAIPEVEVLGNKCRIGVDRESFLREVEEALKDPGPSHARSEAIREESWQARLDDIRAHVAKVVDAKQHDATGR